MRSPGAAAPARFPPGPEVDPWGRTRTIPADSRIRTSPTARLFGERGSGTAVEWRPALLLIALRRGRGSAGPVHRKIGPPRAAPQAEQDSRAPLLIVPQFRQVMLSVRRRLGSVGGTRPDGSNGRPVERRLTR